MAAKAHCVIVSQQYPKAGPQTVGKKMRESTGIFLPHRALQGLSLLQLLSCVILPLPSLLPAYVLPSATPERPLKLPSPLPMPSPATLCRPFPLLRRLRLTHSAVYVSVLLLRPVCLPTRERGIWAELCCSVGTPAPRDPARCHLSGLFPGCLPPLFCSLWIPTWLRGLDMLSPEALAGLRRASAESRTRLQEQDPGRLERRRPP